MRAVRRLTHRLVLAGLGLALLVATARPARAQGDLYGIIDAPAINGTVSAPFQIRGWALWSGATGGSSGIDTIQVFGCPINNCPAPVFWGVATIGLPRPDVVAAYGYPSGATSGYSFTMAGLAPDVYFVQVWTHNTANGYWLPFNTSFMVIAPPEHVLEHPTPQQSLAQPFTVSGWAIDANAPTGTGVDAVHVNAYHNFGNGTPSYLLGSATYGDARTDVAAARGSRFLHSGYHFIVTGQPPGWYRVVGWSHSTASGIWTGRTVDAYVDIPTVSLEINRSGTGTGSIVGTGLSCPGGSTTQAMPCGASYALGTVAWITAVPDPGSTFAGWGGGCLGPQVTCGVTLNGDRYTFAYFTKTPGTIATTYYHTDVVGSVRALSDQTGATVIRHDYLPFGEDTQPLAGDPLRFAGKELDPESALMNFEARYYRNTWGRFTQVDPIAGSPADPQSWNRYAYARNAPARFVDPNGEQYRVGIDCPFAGDGSRACPSEPPGPFGGPYGNFGGGFGTGSDKCDWGPCGLRKVVPHVIWGRRFLPAPKPAGDNDHTESSDGAADDNNNHHDPDPNKPCDSPPAPPGVDLKKNISAAESVRAFSGAMGEPWLKYFWFAEMSDTGRPFDFKKGGHKEFQDYGNWHYGVLGAALHIPEDVLFRGAGYVQWRNRGPNYDPAWGVPWGSAPYGDDPERDVPWIATGYNYYKSCNG